MIRSFRHPLIAVAIGMSALCACAPHSEAAATAAPAHAVPAAPARMTPTPMTPAEATVRKAMDTIAKGVKIDSVLPAPI
ncbi:MAG TPA: hypothetical protein VK753_07890, partial [Xanthomonadaceae bacterium]|nr:hypothetical protein [Xanthomonadaceae bacterium]